MNTSSSLLIACMALTGALFPGLSHAFSLSPMSVSFEPSGKEATRSFVVDNNSPEKIAVQISMAERKVDVHGVETNPEADDDFIVYPPQLMLGPNEKRTVRVTWAGEAKPPRELSYRIIAEQLPVETAKPAKKEKVMIRMLLRYMGAVYITPKNAEPRVEVTGIARATSNAPLQSGEKPKNKTQNAQPKLALTLENKGASHQLIRAAKVKLNAPNGIHLELDQATLAPILGQNMLAGSARQFLLSWPSGLDKNLSFGNVKAELEVTE